MTACTKVKGHTSLRIYVYVEEFEYWTNYSGNQVCNWAGGTLSYNQAEFSPCLSIG